MRNLKYFYNFVVSLTSIKTKIRKSIYHNWVSIYMHFKPPPVIGVKIINESTVYEKHVINTYSCVAKNNNSSTSKQFPGISSIFCIQKQQNENKHTARNGCQFWHHVDLKAFYLVLCGLRSPLKSHESFMCFGKIYLINLETFLLFIFC